MKRVALQCRWGEGFGMGHIQRMCSLYSFLKTERYEPVIVSRDTLPADLVSNEFRTADSADPSFDLVIRDMRDSSEAEILELKKKAKVVVVDDLGKGRNKADSAIDLLPNLIYPVKDTGSFPFISGFNFSREIDMLGASEVRKTIDFCVYAGALKDDRYVEFLRDCLPSGATAVILNGGEMRGFNIDARSIEGMSYPLPLLCSRNLVSHFGISLFEGALCGCGLYSVNPTKYHSDLCAAAKPLIDIENFGVYPEIDPQYVKNRLKEALAGRTRAVDIGCAKDAIHSGLDQFYDRIKPFI